MERTPVRAFSFCWDLSRLGEQVLALGPTGGNARLLPSLWGTSPQTCGQEVLLLSGVPEPSYVGTLTGPRFLRLLLGHRS